MSHETDRTRYILPKLTRGNYNTLVKLISNSLTFDVSDAAKFRLHVLDHYYRYGIKSACHAFNVPRATVYDWRRVFEKSGKKVSSLIPRSTRPINTRQMVVDPKLVEFIRSLRVEYGNLSTNTKAEKGSKRKCARVCGDGFNNYLCSGPEILLCYSN